MKILKFVLFRIVIPSIIVLLIVNLASFSLLDGSIKSIWENKDTHKFLIAINEASLILFIPFWNIMKFHINNATEVHKKLDEFRCKVENNFNYESLLAIHKELVKYKSEKCIGARIPMLRAKMILSDINGRVETIKHLKMINYENSSN